MSSVFIDTPEAGAYSDNFTYRIRLQIPTPPISLEYQQSTYTEDLFTKALTGKGEREPVPSSVREFC